MVVRWCPSRNGPFSQPARGRQVSVSICGVSCAAYHMYASAQPLDFLDLEKKLLISELDTCYCFYLIYGWALGNMFGMIIFHP